MSSRSSRSVSDGDLMPMPAYNNKKRLSRSNAVYRSVCTKTSNDGENSDSEPLDFTRFAESSSASNDEANVSTDSDKEYSLPIGNATSLLTAAAGNDKNESSTNGTSSLKATGDENAANENKKSSDQISNDIPSKQPTATNGSYKKSSVDGNNNEKEDSHNKDSSKQGRRKCHSLTCQTKQVTYPGRQVERTSTSPARIRKGRTEKIDPFNFFEVKREPCHLLKVRVIRGKNISKGLFQDMLDTPDPYVRVCIREAPDGRKQTSHRDNDPNPEWNEELQYLLPTDLPSKVIAEISLMDSNYAVDETYGTIEFDVSSLPLQTPVLKSFRFNETSEIEIEFVKEIKCGQDLRASLALCNEEKEFRSARKKLVKPALMELMEKRGAGGPRVLRETPTIAVIGSGGGFRAMVGYAGAMKALDDSGVLDCATYVGGLSGSSWYLSTLYASDDFPSKGTEKTKTEMQDSIKSSPFWLLKPERVMVYSQRLRAKMKMGQPVTFTDFFGMLIGQTLLGPKKMQTAKLTDFREKIKDGKAPMPIMTCLHVRPKTSALTFHDWIEFTPYEIGMPKYATFMNTMHFGSKFFMGVLAKQYEEYPLHFLMGVWGSAFSILFNRLTEKNKDASKPEDIREEREELNNEINAHLSQNNNNTEDESDSELDDDDEEEDFQDAKEQMSPKETSQQNTGIFGSIWNLGGLKIRNSPVPTKKTEKPRQKRGILKAIVSSVFGSDLIESREYRAGKILNYMRGVSLSNAWPLSPFTPLTAKNAIAEPNEFKQIHEPIEVRRKKVHLVDAGLTFNSPYPPMLRPQRAVDLIISFDFSKRKADDAEPFKEILLAEKWAHLHNLPFPKIDRSIYEKEGIKECYVFRDESNERAPIIIHFVLCNLQYKKFSKPGVPREAGDNRANFSIYDNPKTPFSTFNFQYSNQAFDQLHDLMEFNTLLHIETIIHEIQSCIQLRRHSHARGSITLKDIRNSRHLSEQSRRSLETTLLSKGEGNRYFPIDN